MRNLVVLAERIAGAKVVIAGAAILAILLNITVDVFMRVAFNAPFSATTEIVSFYYMIPVVFLPLMYLELSGGHIDTDLFYRLFSYRLKRISRLISGGISVGIYGLLTYFTFEQALQSTSRGEVAMGVNLLPIWPVRWVLPFAFILATIAACLSTYNYVVGSGDNG